MNEKQALDALAALSQDTRLAIVRQLVQAGSAGRPAGEIANALDVRQNTLSTHLQKLGSAGLLSRTRLGRRILYAARYDTLRDLVLYLLEDCCGGRADVCSAVSVSLLQRGAADRESAGSRRA